MKPATVWVLARKDDAGLHVLRKLPPGVEVVVGRGPEAFAGAPPPDVLFVCSVGRKEVEAVWEAARGVKWLHSRSAGVEGILFPALVESPVVLTNARGVFSRDLAEFVLGAILFFAKSFRRMIRSQEQGRWDPFDLEPVAGRTVAIVGYGDIGRAVAECVRPLGTRVVALRRRPERSREDPLVDEVVAIEDRVEALARADDVVVAAPLTPETVGLVGEREIRALKPTAVVVNVGRGPVVDEAALIRALEEGRIRGAALDVFDTEPLPAGHAFYRLDNVLLSPHCADHKPGWLDPAMECFIENLQRFRAGEPLLNVVDKSRGY